MKLSVLLPSGISITVKLEPHQTLGKFFLAKVCNHCDIVGEDRLFFGLQYPDPDDGGMNWVEPEDEMKLHARKIVHFQLAVRFFPSCPAIALKDNNARCLFRQHVKGMLMNSELGCETKQHALLDSYVLQAELGDYTGKIDFQGKSACTEIWAPTSLTAKSPISEQEYLKLVCKFYGRLVGMTKEQANIEFLRELQTLPVYGCKLHKVSDKDHGELYIRLSEEGVFMWHGGLYNEYQIPASHEAYKWSELVFCERDGNKLRLGFFSEQHGTIECAVKVPCKFSQKGAERLQKDMLACRAFFLNKTGGAEVFRSRKAARRCHSERIPPVRGSISRRINSMRTSFKRSLSRQSSQK